MPLAMMALMLLAGTDAKPIGDPGAWLSSDDYPKSETSRGISGVTSFALTVSKTGTVEDCTVTGTSGSEALDATACALLKVRAHFIPAHDTRGAKIESIYNNRVRWQLPKNMSIMLPLAPQVLTIEVDESEKGLVEDCVVVARPPDMSDTAPTPCINFPAGRQLRLVTGSDGKPVKIKMTITQSVSLAQR